MKLRIESTPLITSIGGVPVRLWEGVTEDGIPCKVFVHRVCVALERDQRAFEQELSAMQAPGASRVVDLRHVL